MGAHSHVWGLKRQCVNTHAVSRRRVPYRSLLSTSPSGTRLLMKMWCDRQGPSQLGYCLGISNGNSGRGITPRGRRQPGPYLHRIRNEGMSFRGESDRRAEGLHGYDKGDRVSFDTYQVRRYLIGVADIGAADLQRMGIFHIGLRR
jgi:hypothetical protein